MQSLSYIEVIPGAYSRITNLLVQSWGPEKFQMNIYLDILREIGNWVFERKLYHENGKNPDEYLLQLASYKCS